jgi:cytochrome oxidase Cu insertion factor (SCO1/SenC/PrrC family)
VTGGQPVEQASASPPALRVLRYGLWALLLMVLSGLALVWWWAPGGRARAVAARLPVLGTMPAFSLLDSSGRTVGREALAGRPWVAGLIFTRCRLSCPLLTQEMVNLELPPSVGRLAISVDPAHDTPAVLAAYGRQHGIAGDRWLLLTGDDGEVRRLAVEGFKLGVARTPPDHPQALAEPITHSTRLVLVDGAGAIRGYYDVFDAASEAALESDAAALAMAGPVASADSGPAGAR